MHEIQVLRYKNRHFTKKINIGNLQLTKIPVTILFLKDVAKVQIELKGNFKDVSLNLVNVQYAGRNRWAFCTEHARKNQYGDIY
jgi:hypothetical protein